jgi:hypothetical protein
MRRFVAQEAPQGGQSLVHPAPREALEELVDATYVLADGVQIGGAQASNVVPVAEVEVEDLDRTCAIHLVPVFEVTDDEHRRCHGHRLPAGHGGPRDIDERPTEGDGVLGRRARCGRRPAGARAESPGQARPCGACACPGPARRARPWRGSRRCPLARWWRGGRRRGSERGPDRTRPGALDWTGAGLPLHWALLAAGTPTGPECRSSQTGPGVGSGGRRRRPSAEAAAPKGCRLAPGGLPRRLPAGGARLPRRRPLAAVCPARRGRVGRVVDPGAVGVAGRSRVVKAALTTSRSPGRPHSGQA